MRPVGVRGILRRVITREAAALDLLARLDSSGFRAGRMDLTSIWPALSSWMHEPVSDVAPADDERTFYLSFAPAGAPGFAGAPPEEIASADLVCIEFGREFRSGTPHEVGSAGMTLWFAAGEPWAALEQMPEWIAMGPSTPHLDAFACGNDSEWLTAWIEDSPVYAIASRANVLAATVGDDHGNDVLVLAP